jgi:predicted RNA-binding protein Jag
MDDRERLKIAIMQMLEYNNVHLKEYEKWARFAETNHMTDAGTLLGKTGKYAESVSALLRQTLNHLSLAETAGEAEKDM